MIWFRLVIVLLFVSAVPASLLAFSHGVLQVLTWWYGVAILLFIAYAKVYMVGALRQRRAEPILAGAAGSLNVIVGVRDWWVVRAGGNFGEVAWVRYSSVLFGLALFFIVVMRFRAASAQARDLLTTLAARVQEKERELVQSYRELELMAREQERVAERSRILRDMHDGVGAHISAAIHQLQSGPVARDELLQTLRDSLDHLKLSIDAMNLPPGDLNVLLAGLRYRLEPRLRAAGISLVWEVALLQPLTWLDSRGMRHLQFMVFEIVSNVLQHAQASTLRFELRATPGGGALLALVDNGRGFPPERDPSQGLRTLRQRAQALGASLEVRTSPGRTAVMVRLQAPLLTIVPPAARP